MVRPIEGEGTCSDSTGRPGREKAAAVPEPPVAPTIPDSNAAPSVAAATPRLADAALPTKARIFPMNTIALPLRLHT